MAGPARKTPGYLTHPWTNFKTIPFIFDSTAQHMQYDDLEQEAMNQQTPKRLILVVDDESTVRDLLAKIMATIPGVQTLTAATAQEALQLALSNPVKMVITDMNMHGETGSWLLQQLRAKGLKVPVVLHSGSLVPEDEPRLLEMGAACVIRKPASPIDIIRTVSRLLG